MNPEGFSSKYGLIAVSKTEKNGSKIQTEEDDYYLENGLLVFTASYHLKRGYCCKSDCRHCPYTETGPKEEKELRDDESSVRK